MRRQLLLVSALAVVVSACASSGAIGFHVERGADFRAYRTFDWGLADALPAPDPRFVANAVFVDHVYGALERELLARGLRRAVGQAPDVLVHYHPASSTRRVLEPPACYGTACDAGEGPPAGARTLTTVDEGTLVIDIVDARTARPVWRGWVRDDAAVMLRQPERVDAAIARVVATFPAPLAASGRGGR